MDARHHFEEVRQGLLFPLELLGTNDGHSTGGEDLLPCRPFRLYGNVGRCVLAGRCGNLLAIHGGARRRHRLCSCCRRGTQCARKEHPQDTRDKMLLFPFLRHERASILFEKTVLKVFLKNIDNKSYMITSFS